LRRQVLRLGTLVQGFYHLAMVGLAIAAAAQAAQLFFQHPQLGQALAHMSQVLIQRGAGLVVGLVAGGVYGQQAAHLIERHVHGPAQAYEAQPVQVCRTIKTIAVVAPHTWAQQAFLLVIADIRGGHARQPGGVAYAVLRALLRHA